MRGSGASQSGQGWGRLSLLDILPTAGTATNRLFEESLVGTEWNAGFTGAGQSRTASFTVDDATKPVTIVAAWSDDAVTPTSGATLVNNVNLKIQVGSCYKYYGNRFNSTDEFSMDICGIGITKDGTNNLEVVRAPAGALTTFSIVVESYTYGSIRPRVPFALYVKNAHKN